MTHVIYKPKHEIEGKYCNKELNKLTEERCTFVKATQLQDYPDFQDWAKDMYRCSLYDQYIFHVDGEAELSINEMRYFMKCQDCLDNKELPPQMGWDDDEKVVLC